jgi:5'-nucleotidase
LSLQTHFADERPKLFLDMDGVLCDYGSAAAKVMAERDLDRAEVAREYGFYLGLVPLPGAIEAVGELDKVFNIYILSTPKWSNPNSFMEKRMWVERHLYNPGFKKLILTHNKGLFAGRALVDDNPTRNNQNQFGGELIQFGKEPFQTWAEVLPYLLENPNEMPDNPDHDWIEDIAHSR